MFLFEYIVIFRWITNFRFDNRFSVNFYHLQFCTFVTKQKYNQIERRESVDRLMYIYLVACKTIQQNLNINLFSRHKNESNVCSISFIFYSLPDSLRTQSSCLMGKYLQVKSCVIILCICANQIRKRIFVQK